MANNNNVTGTITVKPFIVDIFDDGIYITFTGSRIQNADFNHLIQFPKHMKKTIIKFLEEWQNSYPEYITLHKFPGEKIQNRKNS